jgi:hypothetical protein
VKTGSNWADVDSDEEEKPPPISSNVQPQTESRPKFVPQVPFAARPTVPPSSGSGNETHQQYPTTQHIPSTGQIHDRDEAFEPSQPNNPIRNTQNVVSNNPQGGNFSNQQGFSQQQQSPNVDVDISKYFPNMKTDRPSNRQNYFHRDDGNQQMSHSNTSPHYAQVVAIYLLEYL